MNVIVVLGNPEVLAGAEESVTLLSPLELGFDGGEADTEGV